MTHRVLRTALRGLVIVLALGACQQGPGGSANHTHDVPDHTHDPTAIVLTKYITVRTSHFQSAGSLAKAFYTIPEITAEVMSRGFVEAYYDIGSGGEVWVPLPDSLQFPDLVVATVGYLYRQGQFELTISSPAASAIIAAARALDGHRVKLLIFPPT